MVTENGQLFKEILTEIKNEKYSIAIVEDLNVDTNIFC